MRRLLLRHGVKPGWRQPELFTLTREFDPPRIDGLPKAQRAQEPDRGDAGGTSGNAADGGDALAGFIVQLVLQRMILVTNPWGQPTFLRSFSSSTLSDASKWRCAMLNWQSRGLLLGAKWA